MHHPLHPFPISIFLHPQVLLHIRKSSPSLYTLLSGLVKICIQLNLGPDQTSNSCPCVQAYTTQPVTTGGPIQKYQDKTQILRVQAAKNKYKNTKTSLRSHTQKKLFLPEIILFLPSRFLKCVRVKRPDNFTKSTWTNAWECSCGTCRHGTADVMRGVLSYIRFDQLFSAPLY